MAMNQLINQSISIPDREETREVILSLWRRVERSGIEELITFLIESDFFEAPCSTEYHLAMPGGLARHSLNVYDLLRQRAEQYYPAFQFDPDALIICGLGHDLCKVNAYVPGTRNVKENGVWREKKIWQVKDKLPLGHGEKSVSILQDFIYLEPEEKLAIRWHMGMTEAGTHFSYPAGYAYRAACAEQPLVTLLHTADLEASYILEAQHE